MVILLAELTNKLDDYYDIAHPLCEITAELKGAVRFLES
jgi:hypothetical protein